MNLTSILAAVTSFIPFQIIKMEDIGASFNFISKYIDWLISWSTVGIGVILFTLTLRLIVLPFDIYSKVKNQQNAVKMKAMKADLEKLQRQYANDKQLYNQKMLALQKKNGYSPLAGCLPMILSLIIFFVAIDAFRAYSAIAMTEEYNNIIICYNETLEETVAEDPDLFVKEGEPIVIDGVSYYAYSINNEYFFNNIETLYPEFKDIKGVITIEGSGNDANFTIEIGDGNKLSKAASDFIDLLQEKVTDSEIDLKKDYGLIGHDDGCYEFDYKTKVTPEEKAAYRAEFAGEIFKIVATSYKDNEVLAKKVDPKISEAYEDGSIETSSFLWVKNIWMPDVSYRHPISDFEGLKSNISAGLRKSCSCSTPDVQLDRKTYDVVTAGLSEQKTQANGYYVMVILSIVTMFLSQFILTRMQKTQLELQSVDGANGQAAMTQKMMMWTMPIIFGIFAFSYSTAFSIYMTVSSIVSTLSSIIINVAVERKYGSLKSEAEVQSGRSMKNVNRINKERQAAEKEAAKRAEEKAAKKNKRNKK